MKTLQNYRSDEERALYGETGLLLEDAVFDGPADGESALKECADIETRRCRFNLRYPFWHDTGLTVTDCELTELCRAPLWYTKNVTVTGTKLHGVKALRECENAVLRDCDIVSPEFGWSTHGLTIEDSTVAGEYFLLRASDVHLKNVNMTGKYSFQYVENCTLENSRFDTKDAFWHAKNFTVRDCEIVGEYLAWYSENLTFVNCVISGTQPFCYCKNLRLINCEMRDADLAFERSDVQADLTAPIISIKNPLSGEIRVPAVGDLIFDIPQAQGKVTIDG